MKFTWAGLAALLVANSVTAQNAPAELKPATPAPTPTGVLGPATPSDSVPASADSDEVQIQASDGMGEVEWDREKGTVTYNYDKGVLVTFRNATLTARLITVEREAGQMTARGDVVISKLDAKGRPQVWRGERVRYNYRTGQIDTDAFRMGTSPFFLSGTALEGGRTNQTQVVTNAVLTSDDLSNPGYKIKARSLTIGPDRTITAKDAVLYLGNVPVSYFPTYHRNLDRHPNFWTITPGYRSLFGPFVLGTYHYFPSTNVETTLKLDWRQKRGFGGGPGIEYDLQELGHGEAGFYYTRDDEPGTDPAGVPISRDRYRTFFNHQVEVGDGFQAKAVVRQQSDPYVIRDFFEYEYRRDTQPKSFLEVSQFWRNFSLDAIAQPQINDFYRTVERLPDVKLTGLRQQIGNTPVYYESESSLAYLRFREGILSGVTATNYAAFRADTYHQLVLPQTYFGWLNFSPRVGGRFTHYGEIDGLTNIVDSRERWVVNTGAEMSFRASRVWGGVENSLLDMQGARHIVEPSINYAFVPRPNWQPYQLPKFDSELPSSRLLPLEFPDYNSIDSVDSQNTLRFSLRNKLQTKRRQEVENVFNWALYTDWRLTPNPGQSTFPDFYSDLDFSPRSWILLNSQVRYDINGHHWREAYHRLTLQPADDWSWSIGHRYLRDDPLLYGAGNNLFTSTWRFRVNEDWSLRMNHQFEARDGRLEEQGYTVYRDLRSWTTALTLRLRDPRGGKTDWAVVLTFQLKAFPRFKLNQDRDRTEWLTGG